MSPQVVELLGISQDEWLNNPYAWRHHVHPEDIDRAWDEYQHAYGAHEPLNHEYRMIHEDGTVRWVLEQAYPIDDEHGEPWLIQGVIFDITERKRAEEQVAFLAYHDKLTGLPTGRCSRRCWMPRSRALDGTTWGWGSCTSTSTTSSS